MTEYETEYNTRRRTNTSTWRNKAIYEDSTKHTLKEIALLYNLSESRIKEIVYDVRHAHYVQGLEDKIKLLQVDVRELEGIVRDYQKAEKWETSK